MVFFLFSKNLKNVKEKKRSLVEKKPFFVMKNEIQGFSKFSGRLFIISGNGRANIFQIAKGGAAFQN